MRRARLVIGSLSIALAVAPLVASAQIADAVNGGAAAVPGAPDIETAAYTFAGEVNADNTRIHSGPSENDYPVLRVNKGTRLVVVGMRNDWLKIEPPEGAFCLVPQAFVDKFGDGKSGRVIENRAVVRIGSSLLPARHKVPMQLNPGAEVQIIGTDNEFYKIEPPKGVYLYVDKKFVNPVRRLDATPTTPEKVAPPKPEENSTGTGNMAEGKTPAEGGTAVAPQPGAPDTSTFTVRGKSDENDAGSTTRPAVAADQIRDLQEKLAGIEDRYAAASKQDISEQPLDELLKDYEALLADPALPPTARRVADYRAQSLRVRKETLAQLAEAKRLQAEAAEKQAALEAERAQIQLKVQAAQTVRFNAIGRLAASSLMAGSQPLYRLVDPANGRTIIYVRPVDAAPIAGLNQFVAINGNVVKDDGMKITYVEPTAYETIDANQVNKKYFADYSPPSLATANLAAGQ